MMVREVTRVIVINHRVTRDSRIGIARGGAGGYRGAYAGPRLRGAATSGFMIGRDGTGMNGRYF